MVIFIARVKLLLLETAAVIEVMCADMNCVGSDVGRPVGEEEGNPVEGLNVGERVGLRDGLGVGLPALIEGRDDG